MNIIKIISIKKFTFVSVLMSNKSNSRSLMSRIRAADRQDEIITLIKSRASNQIGFWLPFSVLIFDLILVVVLLKTNILPLL